ncbi:MAG: PilZ domain-containing protein [Gammaproteobacteria bacterium]
MLEERRLHPRLALEGVKAYVTLTPAHDENIELEGHIVDISYTGVKIRLVSPMPNIRQGRISIAIMLPRSGIPLTIKGEIRHMSPDSNYGMEFDDNIPLEKRERLLFECIKFSKDSGIRP